MECGRSKARAGRFNPVLELCKGKKKKGKHAKLFANAIQAARDVAGTAKP